MSILTKVIEQVQFFNNEVDHQVAKVREDPSLAAEQLTSWQSLIDSIPTSQSPSGVELPRLPLPELDEAGAIVRYLKGEGLPGHFPYVSSIYPELYLDPLNQHETRPEEPTRLFAGLGLAEDTNERFRMLSKNQMSHRLSTAFDGPTLYGMDSDAAGVFGKIGEGGVAIDTVEDMEALFEGYDLTSASTSVSMTINGPAPTILAMYVAAARRRFGTDADKHLRGTVQADILKEVQGQNEVIFALDASLRFLLDTVEYCIDQMPRWYPISISGYHISQAGATPVQQAAYTLSNGFAYAKMMQDRGIQADHFAPRFSFFFDCGMDVEFIALTRVCRKIWAIGMRDVFDCQGKGQKLKAHTQTSGRSLVSAEFENNLTRTAAELMMAYINATNSSHSNSADEPFTTPSEKYARLASHAQSILLEESGMFRHMMNGLAGSPGMKAVEKALEKAILEEFSVLETMGGVLGAMEQRYQRSQIQAAAYRYENQIIHGNRPIIGLNRYAAEEQPPTPEIVRLDPTRKQHQIERLREFKNKNQANSATALTRLRMVVRDGGNVFEELIQTVESCSLGQITEALQQESGKYRPLV